MDTDQGPPTGTRRVTQLLHAYLDDTGKDPKADRWAIAGYVGMAHHFSELIERWHKLLDGPPWLQYWHTNTARNTDRRHADGRPKNGGYSKELNLSREYLEGLELRLAELLVEKSRDIVAVSIELDKSLYKRVVEGAVSPHSRFNLHPAVREAIGSPFYVMFHHMLICIHIIAKRMGSGIDGTQIFMEDAEGEEWQDQVCIALRGFRRMANADLRKSISQVTFAPGKGRVNVAPLQAADLYAWHLRRKAMFPEEVDHARLLLMSISGAHGDPKKCNRVVLDEDRLERFVRAINAGVRDGRDWL
ncbi:MAG: hypothetical protein JNN27_20690 [Planctomycetes bacterium]|nr:hypothetical protein [Planctomycetota bacterium]